MTTSERIAKLVEKKEAALTQICTTCTSDSCKKGECKEYRECKRQILAKFRVKLEAVKKSVSQQKTKRKKKCKLLNPSDS